VKAKYTACSGKFIDLIPDKAAQLMGNSGRVVGDPYLGIISVLPVIRVQSQ